MTKEMFRKAMSICLFSGDNIDFLYNVLLKNDDSEKAMAKILDDMCTEQIQESVEQNMQWVHVFDMYSNGKYFSKPDASDEDDYTFPIYDSPTPLLIPEKAMTLGYYMEYLGSSWEPFGVRYTRTVHLLTESSLIVAARNDNYYKKDFDDNEYVMVYSSPEYYDMTNNDFSVNANGISKLFPDYLKPMWDW